MSFVVFYAIFANISFWAASRWLDLLPLGWFCVEYAGIGILALYLPRLASAGLLLLVIAADLISGVSKTYYLSPSECLTNSSSLSEFPAARLFLMAAVGALVVLTALVAVRLPVALIRGNDRRRAVLCLLAFAALALAGDCAAVVRETGHWPNPFQMVRVNDANKFSRYSNLWISRYPLLRLVRNERMFGRKHVASGAETNYSPVSSAASVALRSAGLATGANSKEKPNLVLILVESWGLDSDAVIRQALVRPYSSPELQARFEILQGTVPFYGSTIAGEARELCGSKIGSDILGISADAARNCLPDQLASLGYHSLAVHGMDGHMFNRSSWYRGIGFQEQWFEGQLLQEGLPKCGGAFVGICDADIAAWMSRRLARTDLSPDFMYWVTLNSHLPVPTPSAPPAGASCALTPVLSQQPSLCSWYQLVSSVHYSVARLAIAKLARPTVFVVVGDHAPPFANPALRSTFSSTEVPYIILLPRHEKSAVNPAGVGTQSGRIDSKVRASIRPNGLCTAGHNMERA